MEELQFQGNLEVYERLYLNELEARYTISRSTLTNRMNRLGLSTLQERKGAAGYVEADGVTKLDELYSYIKEHGSDAGFPYPQQSAIAPVQQSTIAQPPKSDLSQQPIETAELIEQQRPGAAGYTAINPDRMMAQALTMASERLMAEQTAENLAHNPHLLPLELQQQIQQYSAGLKKTIPQPQSPSPEDLAAMVLRKLGCQ